MAILRKSALRFWKFLLLLSVFVLAAGIIWLAIFPVLIFPDAVDLGRTGVGVPFSSSFQITNIGLRTVSIVRVERSCHCTQAKLAGLKLKPFETAVIPVDVNTGRSSGLIREQIAFQDDTIGSKVKMISLNGVVDRTVNIEMETFDRGLIEFKDRRSPMLVPIKLDPNSKPPEKIQYGVFSAEAPVKAAIKYQGSLAFLSIDLSQLPVGKFNKRLIVCGTNENGTQLFQVQCFVTGLILGNWKSTPEAVFFLDPDESENITLTISDSDSKGDAKIYSKVVPESLNKDIKVDVSRFPEVRVQRVISGSERSDYGTLLIGRSDVAEDVVEIPIMLSGKPSAKR